MDFVADQLQDGIRFRSLTIVDVYTREAVAIEAGQSLKGDDVVRAVQYGEGFVMVDGSYSACILLAPRRESFAPDSDFNRVGRDIERPAPDPFSLPPW